MLEIRLDLKKSNMWVYEPTLVSENTWKIGYGIDSGD